MTETIRLRSNFTLIAATFTLLLFAGSAFGQIAITEINSNSDATDDWFELTNAGSEAVDITGWGYDDFPENPDNIAPIEGVTSIGAGESIVVYQFDGDSDVPLVDQSNGFRAAWGGLDGVQLGYHTGSGLGRDDGVSVFDAAGTLVAQQLYFDPAADPEADLHAGESVGGQNIDSAIWDPTSGVDSPVFIAPVAGQLGVFAASDGGLGSPGAVVPEPSTLSLLAVALLLLSVTRRRK